MHVEDNIDGVTSYLWSLLSGYLFIYYYYTMLYYYLCYTVPFIEIQLL